MHRDADGAGLIRDGARDRLPDPPRCVGRELVAAAVFELIDGFHQADIAFLDQVQELQAAVGVFLRNRDHQAQVRLDHFLLGLPGFALALLHDLHDTAELLDIEAGFGRQRVDFAANFLDARALFLDELVPALAFQPGDAVDPVRIEFLALIIAQKLVAAHAIAVGKP